MAGPSQFSTADNYAKAKAAEHDMQQAIAEAQMAVQAGIPGAQETLTTAQDGLKRVQQFLAVYFPQGQPSDSMSGG